MLFIYNVMCLWMVKGYWGHQSRWWGSSDNTWEGGWGASLNWGFREAFLGGGENVQTKGEAFDRGGVKGLTF